METHFSESTLGLLRDAGWHEGRRTPLAPIIEFLGAHSYDISASARAFLEEFHGLTLRSDNCFVVFDVQQAHAGIDMNDVRHLEALVSERPCVIGYVEYGTLFMLPSGKVVHCAVDWVVMHEFDDYIAMLEGISGSKPSLVRPVHLKTHQLPLYLRDESESQAPDDV